MLRRWVAFNAVGLLGVLVQLTVLCFLTGWLNWHYLVGTALGVEAALLHNFLWHEFWTWADRTAGARGGRFRRLVAFHLANGGVSIVGNLLLMKLLVGWFGVHFALANLLTIACCGILNFFAGDRLVFAPNPSGRGLDGVDPAPVVECRKASCGTPDWSGSSLFGGFSSCFRKLRPSKRPS